MEKFVLITIITTLWSQVNAITKVQPRQNIWITWANESRVTDFHLPLQQAGDPFQTCLIGYPKNYTLAEQVYNMIIQNKSKNREPV